MGFSKDKAIEKILENVNQSEAVIFQMDAPGYPEPEKFSFHGGFNNKKYTPDAHVSYEDHSDIFSIETSTSKKHLSEALHKWILFSTHAKKKHGTFYLVVDQEKLKDFEKIIDSKQIKAELIPVKS